MGTQVCEYFHSSVRAFGRPGISSHVHPVGMLLVLLAELFESAFEFFKYHSQLDVWVIVLGQLSEVVTCIEFE